MRKILRMALLFVSLLMCASIAARAQGTAIKGTVTDEKGTALPGVTVSVKGTQVKTNTDLNGKYSITVPAAGKTLIFTFIGMETQEVAIGIETTINVSMKLTSTALTDVVVIGYGSQKRGDVNGAIASVSAKDIQDIPQPSIDQMLQGKAAGVTVTQNSGAPGASVTVNIRGIASFTNTQPLYVIDGVAISGNAQDNLALTSQASPSQQETSVSPLTALNPNDIESIDVLKDASATAIYGSRGANGVVIITTKKGKNGVGKINYDFWYGTQSQGKFLDVMNLQQYASYQNTLATEFGITPRVEFSNPSVLGPGTDWQKAIFSREPEQSHTLSFSGGKDGTDYYVSAGYLTQDGTVIGSDFNRYTVHATINSQVNDWFKAGTSFSASQSNTDIGLGNSYGIIYNALLQAPDAAVYNADGSFAGPVIENNTVYGGRNPVQQALNITNTLQRSNIQGNVHGDIKITRDLTLHSEIDGTFDWDAAKAFFPTYSYGATGYAPAFVNTQASLNEQNQSSTYWNWVEHLNYSHTFGGKHSITALLGHEVWESTYDAIQAGTAGFTSGNGIQTLGLGSPADASVNEYKGSTSMESFIGRVIYTYDDKYSITATDRSDRSSNFSPGSTGSQYQIGNFPGVAVSWKLSQEKFMAGINQTISNLKLRIGYGTTGNSNIPQYAYGSAINALPGALGTAFAFANLPNPQLTWETAVQKNIGLDFSLLNSRIDASVDVYDKTSNHFLFQKPLPAFLVGGSAEYNGASVIGSPYVNAGNIDNKGIEFSITSHNIVSKNFRWNTNLVFSKYTNTVTSLDGFPSLIGTVSTGFGPQIAATLTQAGGPIGEFYGYKTAGIISSQAQLIYLAEHPQNVIGSAEIVSSNRTLNNAVYLGDILYAGNNNGAPNTQYALGNPNPDFTYSITNNFTYQDFDLSVFLVGSEGGKILNALDFQLLGGYQLYQNQLASEANFWTPSNTNTNVPTPRSGFGNNNLVMSDRFLESASYLRLQNVRLSYNLPQAWVRYVKLNSLKVYVSGQNLYVFTKYSGLDPEVGSLNHNPLLQNIDYGRYPNPRIVTFGLNAGF